MMTPSARDYKVPLFLKIYMCVVLCKESRSMVFLFNFQDQVCRNGDVISERSERVTLRSVQLRITIVYVYICIIVRMSFLPHDF